MVLLGFLASLALTLLWVPAALACGPADSGAEGAHAEGGACPGCGAGAVPGDPGHTCHCCPGHWSAIHASPLAGVADPPQVRDVHFPVQVVTLPGQRSAVFHPPRA
jgi:hypothetical protein